MVHIQIEVVFVIVILFISVIVYLFTLFFPPLPLFTCIPRIIHQTWKTKVYSEIPDNFKRGINSWKQMNPGFEHRLYDDQDCLDFITSWYPEYTQLYTNLQLPVQKADVFRYLVIHKFGGVYADIDTKCVKPIHTIVDTHTHSLVVGVEYPPEHNKGKLQIIQWFFAGAPNCETLLDTVKEIQIRSESLQLDPESPETDHATLWLTGPLVFSYVITRSANKSSIKIHPRCTFGSFDTSESCQKLAYLVHGFQGSWKKNPIKSPFKL